MIDLRSDTVTKPSPAMRAAMAAAPVGDDVYGEDPTVNKLQDSMAGMFGKQAALFVSSGHMGNQLAIKSHTKPGDEVIVESESHVFHYEAAAPAIISGVQLRTVIGNAGIMNPADVEAVVRNGDYHSPNSSLTIVENTHNRSGGRIYPLETIRAISDVCKRRNMKLHIDGARLWNASVATGIPLKTYALLADSVTVCFSKGMGAPIGSVLMGDKEFIQRAHKYRKILGGGMRQVGILAAACSFAVVHNLDRLREDHAHARALASAIAEVTPGAVSLSDVQSNLVLINCAALHRTVDEFCAAMSRRGVLMWEGRAGFARAVFHLDISDDDTARAIEAFRAEIKS